MLYMYLLTIFNFVFLLNMAASESYTVTLRACCRWRVGGVKHINLAGRFEQLNKVVVITKVWLLRRMKDTCAAQFLRMYIYC